MIFYDRIRYGLRVGGGAGARDRRFASPCLEILEDRLTPAGNFISDPEQFVVVPEAPVLSRLARFVPSASPQVSDWVSVAAGDSHLDPATNGGDINIYVIAHGWAPGFQDMVLLNGTPLDPLKWWETLDTSLAGSPGTPASPEMFYGSAGGGVQINPTGLAYAITQADPKAVVIAYSWIDDSATPSFENTVPEGADLSEAYTAMNGVRLANALEQALPSTFHAENGQLHLIGHSHGTKVATVATLTLNQTANPNFQVSQLTVLDSPEVDSLLVREDNAANNLWYFLGGLDISHSSPTATQTFVDHYISEFDNDFGPLQGFNPFNTTQTTDALQKIVDVNLQGDVIISSIDFGDLHGYAFNWYGGGSQAWAQNPTPTVANQWSPLFNVANLPTAANYTQSWSNQTQPQFQLTAGNATNSVTDTPSFTDLVFKSTTVTNGSTYNSSSGEISLSENGNSTATFTGKFSPESGLNGISFQYEFTNPGQGDQLIISVTGEDFLYSIYFVMTGTVAGSNTGVGTLSLTSIAGSFFDKDIKIQLIPAAGSSGAAVTISNLQQFTTQSDETLQDGATAGSYATVAGKATGTRELAVFTDPDVNAVASDFRTQVDWGGPITGTPTITVVKIGSGPNSSTWQVLGNAFYTNPGMFAVDVDIRDQKSGTRITAGEQKTFLVTADDSTRFVQSLYLNVLGRAGSTAELNGWVAAIAADATYAQVASGIEHSFEARTRLVRNWYQQYLGRPADPVGEQAWAAQLVNGASEETVLAGLLGSAEFRARAQTQIGSGSPDERDVQFLYQSLLGRTASSGEVAAWAVLLPTAGPQAIALGFLTSPEWRSKTIAANYTTLLHRPADTAGAAAFLSLWNFTNTDATTIRVLFEGSDEFSLNG